jgi:protein MpaA
MKRSLLAVLTAAAVCTGFSHAAAADPTPEPIPTAVPSPSPTLLPSPSPSPTPTPPPPPKPEAVNKTIVIGHSVRGTPLYAYRRHAINPNRRLLIIGSIHGDEPAGVQVARAFRDRAAGASLQSNVEVWVILSLNPDGLAAHTRVNAHGVDLNRNFPYQWLKGDGGTQYYSGPSSASEPETRALVEFDKTYRPLKEIIFHQPYRVVDLSNSTAYLSGLMSQSTGLPTKALGTRHGSNAGYLQQQVRGSIAMTVEFATSATQARLDGALRGSYRVANAR